MRRNRTRIGLLLASVIASGLASRRFPWLLPQVLGDYPGDAFWAMAAYQGVVLIRPGISACSAAVSALAIACGVEFSQIVRTPWLDSVRRTLFGRLVLGSGFDLVDLVAYAVGALLAMILDWSIFGRTRKSSERVEK